MARLGRRFPIQPTWIRPRGADAPPPPGPSTTSVPGGLLGKGEWQVFVADQGGGNPVWLGETSDLTCGRKADEVSVASVVVPLHEDTPRVRPWEHELLLRRDGEDEWAGPVMSSKAAPGSGSLTINAKDLTMWFERRRLENAFSMTADLARIFERIVEEALDPDPSPNISLQVQETGVVGTRSVSGVGTERAADLLRELARTAVDYVASGRVILVSAGTLDLGIGIPLLTEAHFASDLSVDRDGESMASEVTILGESSQIVGTVGGQSSNIGLVQIVESEATIDDNASALAAAESRLDLLFSGSFKVSGTLLPTAPVDLHTLIPGIQVSLRLFYDGLEFEEDARLESVGIQVDENGETITVDLTNLGTS